MKKFFKRTGGLVAIICATVILFTACGGISVKGEQISEEDFAKVIQTSADAMDDGFTLETEMNGKYDGKELKMTMKSVIDSEENAYAKLEMSFNGKSVLMEQYVIKLESSTVCLYKYDGKWKSISNSLIADGGIDLSELDMSGISLEGMLPDSLEDLEYKNGRYYYSSKLLEESEDYGEAYIAFKDGKYIGASIKYENEKGSASAAQKITYSASVKAPKYQEGSLIEYTAYVTGVMADFAAILKEMGVGTGLDNYLK